MHRHVSNCVWVASRCLRQPSLPAKSVPSRWAHTHTRAIATHLPWPVSSNPLSHARTNGGVSIRDSSSGYRTWSSLAGDRARGCPKRAPGHRRHIAHLPFLAVGGKLMAALTLKKMALVAIVQKVGLGKTISTLRHINSLLFLSKEQAQGAEPYSRRAYESVEVGLDKLEQSIEGLRESEAVEKLWTWLQGVDKENPTYASAVVKTYIERFAPYKWLRAVMTDKPKLDAELDKHMTGEAILPEETPQERLQALEKEMHIAFPELAKYHVVLIPREQAQAADQQHANFREEGKAN